MVSFGVNDVRNISVAEPEEAEWSPGTDIGVHWEGACKNFTRHQAREAKNRREKPESSESSLGYSSSDSEDGGKFSRIRALKTRSRKKVKPQKNGQGDMVPVRAAIEHDDEDPEAGEFRAKIEEDFKDVLFEKVYANQIDPKCRGSH